MWNCYESSCDGSGRGGGNRGGGGRTHPTGCFFCFFQKLLSLLSS